LGRVSGGLRGGAGRGVGGDCRSEGISGMIGRQRPSSWLFPSLPLAISLPGPLLLRDSAFVSCDDSSAPASRVFLGLAVSISLLSPRFFVSVYPPSGTQPFPPSASLHPRIRSFLSFAPAVLLLSRPYVSVFGGPVFCHDPFSFLFCLVSPSHDASLFLVTTL
jgi:hypothetical protein